MTFIIAIQLNDSVIVAADNKEIVLKKGEKIPYLENFIYKIECFEPSSPYTLTAIEPMNITVWMFNPNINTIYKDLQSLYTGLKDASTFPNQVDWINYYINRLAPIYQQQSQVDAFMSQSFDFFFQTKDEYFTGHIPNTQKTALEFKEILSNIKII